MDTEIREFCENYKKKLDNDIKISEDKFESYLDRMTDLRDRITFNVNMHVSCPGLPIINMGMSQGHKLFKLDSEDLEYLYNKYSNKLEAEMNTNIEKVKDSYKNVLKT